MTGVNEKTKKKNKRKLIKSFKVLLRNNFGIIIRVVP